METIKVWLKKMLTSLLDELLPDSMRKPTATQASPSATASKPTPKPTPKPEPSNVERHKVAGVSYHTEELLSLGSENYDFDLTKKQLIEEGLTDERVYRTDFYPSKCELIPEPENPEDPKAIKVVVDGVHIGYIKKGSCAHIHKLLHEDRIESVSCEIGGGPYKIVLTDYEDEEDFDEEDGEAEESYKLDSGDAPYYATVIIKLEGEQKEKE